MGKKQHQSDKLYLTATEWSTLYGGKKIARNDPDVKDFRRLPFDHCALSLQPYENPYCDEDGNIFDLIHIVPYLKKFKVNPVTGKALTATQLTKLNLHKNSKGEPHCPVMFKVFNNSTHIAAIRSTGNVFSYEAIEELNIKPKSFKDLLSDEPYQRKDLIILQDPQDFSKFNLNSFHHIKNSLKVDDDDLERAKTDPKARLKKMNNETKEALAELDKTFKVNEEMQSQINPSSTNDKADKWNAANYSTGAVAASFTSTAMERQTEHEAAILEDDVVRYSRVKKKGYVRLTTNLGPLNLELHCDYVPKTCENFIKLCQKGFYNGTIFHRSIRHFMIQGGDPSGKGTGGDSHWGGSFKDEFKQFLSHTGRGILSMANSGPDSNKSQFFLTYRSCKHLDGKHSVFGKIVGGLDTLSAMERIEVDNKDKPIEDIVIQRAAVFVDPFTEADEQLAKERAEELEKAKQQEKTLIEKKKETSAQDQSYKVYSKGIGKFINPALKKEARKLDQDQDLASQAPKKKKKEVKSALNDFSAW